MAGTGRLASRLGGLCALASSGLWLRYAAVRGACRCRPARPVPPAQASTVGRIGIPAGCRCGPRHACRCAVSGLIAHAPPHRLGVRHALTKHVELPRDECLVSRRIASAPRLTIRFIGPADLTRHDGQCPLIYPRRTAGDIRATRRPHSGVPWNKRSRPVHNEPNCRLREPARRCTRADCR